MIEYEYTGTEAGQNALGKNKHNHAHIKQKKAPKSKVLALNVSVNSKTAHGAFDRLNWQHSGEFDQNFSKKSNAWGFAWGFAQGGMGGFGIDRYITRHKLGAPLF